MPPKTFFGFKPVEKEAKQPMVQRVFTEVASNYDLMNDLMSLGLHRIWKDVLIECIFPVAGHEILIDVAGGTGDISHRFIKAGGKHAIICDLNEEMLLQGQQKIHSHKLSWVKGNAEELPFEDNMFDFYTISFGIRNVTNIDKAISEAYRVLKPGGKFACLEFSNIDNKYIDKIYNFYSFNIIPKLGRKVSNNEEAYRYLVESIAKFPKAEQFRQMIVDNSFDFVKYQKLCFGVVAIHTGYKC